MNIAAARSIARVLCTAAVMLATTAQSQRSGQAIPGVDVQKLANGVLGVMSHTVAPD